MTTPFAVKRGIDFVGWKTWWNYRLPRRRTLSTLATKLDSFERREVRPALGGLAQRVDLRRLDENGRGRKFYSMLASYAGHLRHGAALNAWEMLWAKYRWLGALLERREWSFAARWSRRGLVQAQSFHAQYWRLASRAGKDSLVFFRVGRFVEFYGPQRLLASRILGLRAARIVRGRFALTAGFPTSLCEIYLLRAIRQGVVVVVVREEAARHSRAIATRLPSILLIPLGTEPIF